MYKHERQFVGFLNEGDVRTKLRVVLEIESESLLVGSYCIVSGQQREYLTLVVNVAHPDMAARISGSSVSQELQDVLVPEAIAPVAELQLLQAMERDASGNVHLRPARELPGLYSEVYLAAAYDVVWVFNRGVPEAGWTIGYLREQGYPLDLDLQRLVQRSAGVFGATGTGKSFLVRSLLAGLLKQQLGGALVLDMHNEFGFDDTDPDAGFRVRGLKSLGGERVVVAGLYDSGTIRGQRPELEIQISPGELQPADILLLREELNLTDTAPQVLARLVRVFGEHWLTELMRLESPGEWAKTNGVHPAAAEALQRKLLRVYNRPYITEARRATDWRAILPVLQRGDFVVLSFGKFRSNLDYLLVSNLLARRVSDLWQEATDQYRSGQGDKPKPLVIVLEEAHKLLNKQLASQTVFDTLARELRKSHCVVWVVDQRPSQIYDEVLSQLGTRISGWLGDERDIQAVVTGLPGREHLRTLLASLQPRGEALLVGWGLPVPVCVRTRRYPDMVREEFGQ